MTPVRRLARPLLAAPFVAQGLDAFRHPGARVESAGPLVGRVADRLGLPADAEVAVRADGALMVAAGTLYGLGRLPRLSAALLALTLAPVACTEHAFWLEPDPARRRDRRRAFLQDTGLLGAALLAAADPGGRRPRRRSGVRS